MYEPDLYLQKPLEDFVEFFDSLNVRSVSLLDKFFCPVLAYRDPYVSCGSSSELESLFLYRLKMYPEVRFSVLDYTWARRPSVAYMQWQVEYVPHRRLLVSNIDEARIEGVSEILFGADGKIVAFSEFWGMHDGFNFKAYQKALTG